MFEGYGPLLAHPEFQLGVTLEGEFQIAANRPVSSDPDALRRDNDGLVGGVHVEQQVPVRWAHDTVVFALVKGTCDSSTPWLKQGEISFLCPVPGYDRHFTICQDYGIRMIPVALAGRWS